MNTTEISQELLQLKVLLEKSIGRKLNTTTDYQYLEGVVWGRTNKMLSLSTLKRVWGYVEGYCSIRRSTLDILAKTVGYTSFEVFVNDYCNSEEAVSSKRLLTTVFSEQDVPVEGRVEITWNPMRRVLLKHLGKCKFVVEESENSKLSVGDTFSCLAFCLNQPLYLSEYVHKGSAPGYFVVGNKGGLTSVRVENREKRIERRE